MNRVNQSERMVIIVILMAMTIIFTSVVLLFSNNNKGGEEYSTEELIEYSSLEWSVTVVTDKVIQENNDGSPRYKVFAVTHDKAPLDAFSVDKELYDELEINDLVTYSMIEDFVAEKFTAPK